MESDPRKVRNSLEIYALSERLANARPYKVLYWLETARLAGGNVSDIINAARIAAGYAGTKAAYVDKLVIKWKHQKLEDFRCFTAGGMAKLRKGGSPEITKGPHAGDSIALDHVLPRVIVPRLSARFYNLEAIPSLENLAKSAKIGKREHALARRCKRDGLLSAQDLRAIEDANLA